MGELVSTLIKLKDDLAILTPPELTGHKDMLKRDVSKAIGGAKMTWLDNKYVAVSEKEFQIASQCNKALYLYYVQTEMPDTETTKKPGEYWKN